MKQNIVQRSYNNIQINMFGTLTWFVLNRIPFNEFYFASCKHCLINYFHILSCHVLVHSLLLSHCHIFWTHSPLSWRIGKFSFQTSNKVIFICKVSFHIKSSMLYTFVINWLLFAISLGFRDIIDNYQILSLGSWSNSDMIEHSHFTTCRY